MALQTSPATCRHPGVTGLSPGLPEKGDQRQCRHTHKHGEPKTNTRTDKRRPTTQCWVFEPPEFSCPPGTRFALPNGVHCSPDAGSGEELSFPQSWLPSSTLAGLGLAPAGMSSPFPTLYRNLSPEPDTSLLPSRASDLHWTFLFCLSTGVFIYPSPLSWKCSLPLVKGSRTSPQMLCPMSESLSGKREGFQDNATRKKGSLLLTRVRAPATSNTVLQGQRAPSPSYYTNL